MNPKLLLPLCAAALAIALPRASDATDAAPAPLRLVVVGDSTACDYPPARPDRGWGQFLQEHFREGTVKVVNLAAAGRSTKTFLKEGRWQKALDEKPDYVLIQFGHNDSHAPDRPEATDAATSYRDNLRRYIDEARAGGAVPILVTPMVRRMFDADGKIAEGTGENNLAAYAEAMKEVGREKKTAVIDLHASSLALAEKLGPAGSAELANKPGDNTHFNEKGARAMADLIVKDLPAADPKLAQNLNRP